MGAGAHGQYSIVCYFHPSEYTQMCNVHTGPIHKCALTHANK